MEADTRIDVRGLREFFHDTVHDALAHQKVQVDDHTEHYVVNLLTEFARTEQLFEPSPDGPRLRPLALMLAEAAQASQARRCELLQRLGDVSLFVAGFLARGFERKLIDVDYHIAMGGRAYSVLADRPGSGARGRALGTVFAELAAKFQRLVDALNEVSELSYRHTQADLLRLYELWLRTGSPRAHGLLLELGVQPAPTPLAVARRPN
jgi:hypothetical protein